MEGRGERCREGAASVLKRFVSDLWAVRLLSPEPFKLSIIFNTSRPTPGHSAAAGARLLPDLPPLSVPFLAFCSSNRPQCHHG